jgi:hypothetical protein
VLALGAGGTLGEAWLRGGLWSPTNLDAAPVGRRSNLMDARRADAGLDAAVAQGRALAA